MKPALECDPIIGAIKRDFGTLWQCRNRGNSIEIVTPFSTATQKFVSVFITRRDDSYVVTDGGWVSSEDQTYGLDEVEEDSGFDAIIEHFCKAFKIYSTREKGGRFFYKKVSDDSLISSAVYDVANFISSVVNSLSIPVQEEVKHREAFRNDANSFLLKQFPNAKFGQHPLDDYKTAIFHAVIIYPAQMSLVAYVTGTRNNYFVNQFQRAVVNFELAAQSRLKAQIKGRIAFINNEAGGYSPQTVNELSPLLTKYHAQPLQWTERESALSVL
jgi:hypothetical protein